MAEPPDQMPAAAGRGHLRASHADREHAIEVLKAAYVQGMLTKDELDARLGQALASRTHIDLAALTTDIPPGTPATRPERPPAPARRRPLARAGAWSGGCLTIAAAAVWGAFILDPGPNAPGPQGPPGVLSPGLMLVIALYAVLAAFGIMAIGVSTSLTQRRSRGQLPPRPGPGGHALGGQRRSGPGHGPVPPGPRAGQARAGLQTHKPRQHTSPSAGRAPRGTRPAPGAV